MEAEQGSSVVLSGLWLLFRHMGPRKYWPACETFMAPLPSQMNFALGGGGVIMTCSLVCSCVSVCVWWGQKKVNVH